MSRIDTMTTIRDLGDATSIALLSAQAVRGAERLPKIPAIFVEMHRLAVEGERNRRMQATQFQFDMERAMRRTPWR
jgi:hypothetical protein